MGLSSQRLAKVDIDFIFRDTAASIRASDASRHNITSFLRIYYPIPHPSVQKLSLLWDDTLHGHVGSVTDRANYRERRANRRGTRVFELQRNHPARPHHEFNALLMSSGVT